MSDLVEIEITKRWYDKIISGEKMIEGRKKSPKWAALKVGQVVILKCVETGHSRLARIPYIHEYNSLEDYLRIEGVSFCLPGVTDLEDGKKIYQQWSTPEELARYKFLGIGVVLF